MPTYRKIVHGRLYNSISAVPERNSSKQNVFKLRLKAGVNRNYPSSTVLYSLRYGPEQQPDRESPVPELAICAQHDEVAIVVCSK